IIPGRASLLELPWQGSSTVNILNIYAPSGNARANTEFWSALLRQWTHNRSLPRVHILLGDFNVVESKYDRFPPKADPAEPIDALDRFKQHFHLMDGWRQVHGPSKPDFTFSMTNSVGRKQWSRLDRIYLQDSLIDQSCEWQTTHLGSLSDHYLVSAVFEPPGTPFVGKGRSTAPVFILDFPEAQRLLIKRAIQLDSDARRVLEEEITDDNKYAIQEVWSSFKRDLLNIATAFARERTSRIDSMLNLWSARRDKILATASESDPDEVEIAL
ncbi:Endonuclease/exonuclease/phosphatase, partial [Ephemerocybe angulata]